MKTIKSKLRFAFIALAGMFVMLGITAIYQIHNVNDKSTEIELNWLPSTLYTNAMNTATGDLRIAEALHVISTEDAEMMRRENDIRMLLEQISTLRSKYEPLISSPEEKAKYETFSKKYEQYLILSKEALALSRKNANKEAAAKLKDSGVVYDEMSSDLLDLVKINENGAYKASAEGNAIYDLAFKIIILVSVLVTALAIFLMWYFERAISKPLEQMTGMIKQLADGNVNITQAFQERSDEIGDTAKAVGNITKTLKLLTSDSSELIGSIESGILSARAEGQHPGEYGEIIKGMNKLLEVLTKPITEISDVMQRFALGDLKTNMQGAYEGDLRTLKANVNRSLDSLVTLFSELGEITNLMSKGNLTKRVNGAYQGEFLTLKNNMNNVLTQLSESIKIIIDNTANIASGVIQTSKTSLQVSEQSSQQMGSIIDMANAVTEASASIKFIAENAKRSNDLAGSTSQLAEVGLKQLDKLVEVIEQISTEYGRIEQITGKITRIADKTHLLSLNAGLEAVRAGEHGLGFGFVAQQIGKLAEEASIAARDIGNLITGSMQSVRVSVAGSRETRTAMGQIASAAQESGAAVQSISVALGQQSTAIEWISDKVRKMQISSEANAASAKEISQTMTHLSKTVEHTNIQVQKFTLTERRSN